MKYLILAREGIESVHLFPDHIPHADQVIEHSENGLAIPAEILGAGFLTIVFILGQPCVETHGHSESLRTSPRPEDAVAIMRFLMSAKEAE